MVKQNIPNNNFNVLVENFKVSKENVSKEAEGSDSETVKIEGFALPFDTVSRNGVLYRKESVIKAAETMVGRPMFFNHNIEELPIGQVEAFEVSSDGKGMNFKAILDNKTEREKAIVEKVRNGRINKVSIQCMYENVTFNDEDGTMSVDVSEFLELSPVTIPGFDDTTALAVESYKQMSKVKKEAKAKTKKEDAVSEQDDDESSTEDARLDAIEAKQAEIETRLGTVEARLDVEDEEESEEGNEADDNSEEADEDPDKNKEEKLEDEDNTKIERATAPAAKEESKETFDANKWKAERRKSY